MAKRGRPRRQNLNRQILEDFLSEKPTPAPSQFPSSQPPPSPTTPLQLWLENGTGDVQSVASNFPSIVDSPSPPGKSAQPSPVVLDIPTTNAEPGKLTLSAEDRNKFHGLLSGVVTRANVVIVGLGIKTFGRRLPGEPSKSDLELLEKAWEAQLALWFGSADMPPYALILAASIGMGFGMWAEGEPLPPKAKNDKPASNFPDTVAP